MAEWLKLCAIYTLPIVQIWCHSEEGILSRQLSCLETTARHAQVVPGRFFLCFNRTAPQRIENTTLSLSWSERLERCERCVVV